MKTFRYLFFVLCACAYSFISVDAQKLPMKFGKIDPEAFNIKVYEQDTSAEALILGDYGQTTIELDHEYDLVLTHTRHLRVKIFKKSALHWATGNIILYNYGTLREEVSTLKGVVYNMENGNIVKSSLEKSMIFDNPIDKKHTEKKFTLPNVREGSIIEYTYTMRSTIVGDIPGWNFQYTVPALFSEYRVTYPEWFYFKRLMKGYLVLDVNDDVKNPAPMRSPDQISYMLQQHRMIKNNVPAFKEEPYMNALSNYISNVDYELATFTPPYGMIKNFTRTWEAINEEMLKDEDFGWQIKYRLFLKETADMLMAQYTDNNQRIAAAYEFIRNRMKWNGSSRIYVTTSLKAAWEKMSGSSADINLMLVTLLKHMDFDAEPVILSTRSNGMVHPGQIMLGQFNYVIASVKVDDNMYLFDATEKACPYNMLTSRCINGQGRVISNKRPGWVDLNSTQRFEHTNMVNATIQNSGQITGTIQHQYGNYAALNKRIEIATQGDHDKYIREVENDHQGMTINKFELVDLDSLYKPFKEVFEVEISDVSSVAGNLISFSPILYPEWTSNPFKMDKRTFPVDFIYPRIYRDIINYILPEGYVVDEKPENIVMSMPDGKTKFTYRLAVRDNLLQVMSTLDIGKSLYTADEYEFLKQFYGSVVSKQNEKIVLKKVAN